MIRSLMRYYIIQNSILYRISAYASCKFVTNCLCKDLAAKLFDFSGAVSFCYIAIIK